MKWFVLLLAGGLVAFWLDSSNPYSNKAHAMLDSLTAEKKPEQSYLPAPDVPLPPSHPIIAVAMPTDDNTTVSAKVDPLQQGNDKKHAHHSMGDMVEQAENK